MQKSYKRGMAIAMFIIILSVGNFLRLSDSECIRAIHIVTLLVCGMGIGVLLTNFFGWLRSRKNQ